MRLVRAKLKLHIYFVAAVVNFRLCLLPLLLQLLLFVTAHACCMIILPWIVAVRCCCSCCF